MGKRVPSGRTTATALASGRSARTMTPPSGPGCVAAGCVAAGCVAAGGAPSTGCGSWWVPPTIRSISSRLTCAGRSGVLAISGVGNRAERDVQPVGPIPGLVHHLIDRLVKDECAEQGRVRGWIHPARLGVPGAERGLVAPHPLASRVMHARLVSVRA